MDGTGDIRSTMQGLSDQDWRARLEDIGDVEGYFEPLGSDHFALFSDDGPVLLVSFESRDAIRGIQDDHLPQGLTVARQNGWSSLTLVCDHETWFRDPHVFAYFDRLIDEAFFEDFDKVVFFGIGAHGYAACAFSVAAPGATVLAVSPQATLDPALAGWDDRFPAMRRTSFDDRYGFAPEMLEAVGEGYIFFDPFERVDAMHAALYRRPNVTLMPCRFMGAELGRMLFWMDLIEPMLSMAGAGEFSATEFWRLYRARRDNARYLRMVSAELEKAKRPVLDAIWCRAMSARLHMPRYRRRYELLAAELETQGITVPAPAA